MKRKILSIVLALVLALSCLPLFAVASEKVTPVVIVGGYTAPQLYLFDGNGYNYENIVKKIWDVDMDSVLETIKSDIPDLSVASLSSLVDQNSEKLKSQILSGMEEYIEYLKCNTDGTVHENTGTWPVTPEESNLKFIYDNMDKMDYLEYSIREARYAPTLAEKVGAENVYSFSVDFRQANILCAYDLGRYIKSVIEYHGSKQVSIICESHGGETTSDYISLSSIVKKAYDGNKTAGLQAQELSKLIGVDYDKLGEYFNLKYIKNAVLNSPAIGVQLAYDLIHGTSHIDITRVMEFVEEVFNPLSKYVGGNESAWEADLEYLLACLKFDNLNEFINELVQTTSLMDVVLSFGSMWDFIPYCYYDEIKAEKLNTPEKEKQYEGLIAYTDYFHYTVMANMSENLRFARSMGVNVNIVAGTDITTCTGSLVNGDSLVATRDSTGAKVTDYGTRFSDGYKTDCNEIGVHCTDSEHNHVSPAMNIDAAYAYLPENTWFISGQYHAQYTTDTYATALMTELLLTDEMCDIYTYEQYPQFSDCHNAKLSLIAKFDNSQFGRLTAGDTKLQLANISAKSDIELVAIKIEGAGFTVKDYLGVTIPVGETKSFELDGQIPDEDMKNVTVTVFFLENNTTFTLGYRKFNFTVTGGSVNNYDSSNPFTKVNEKPIYLTVDNIKDGITAFGFSATIKGLILSFISLAKYMVRVFENIKLS